MKNLSVRRVNRSDCEDLIINVHYAHRWPSVTWAYGLFDGDEMIGCVTYGTPPSSPLRNGVAGVDNSSKVIELNRMVLSKNCKNYASFLISKSLKMLPKFMIVVSFADIGQGHNGCIYRASNFNYYGLSAKRTDWKVRGKEHLHGQTIADEFRGCKNRAAAMREKYGEDFYLSPRSRKHRYIYVTGSGKEKRNIESQIKYKKSFFKADML